MVPHDHVLVLGKLDRPLHFFKSTKISRQALVLKLLVSGGVGYIGTHSIIEIMNAEHDISEIDDLSKSHIAALPWVKQPAKRNLAFVQADLCDTVSLVSNLNTPDLPAQRPSNRPVPEESRHRWDEKVATSTARTLSKPRPVVSKSRVRTF